MFAMKNMQFHIHITQMCLFFSEYCILHKSGQTEGIATFNTAEKDVTIQQQQWRMLGSNCAIPVRLSLIFSLILVKSV